MLIIRTKMAKTPDNEQPSRIHHALTYCALRSLELDLGMAHNSLTTNHFDKHAFGIPENNPHGAGVSCYIPPNPTTLCKEPTADRKERVGRRKRANFGNS